LEDTLGLGAVAFFFFFFFEAGIIVDITTRVNNQ
jgi:hypothetical protein